MSLLCFLLLLPAVSFGYCLATFVVAALTSNSGRAGHARVGLRALLGLSRETLLQSFVFLNTPIDLLRRRWSSHLRPGQPYLILLPGYAETDVIFSYIRRRLRAVGYGYVTVRYRPLLGDLNEAKRQAANVIADISAIHHSAPHKR